MCQRVGGKWIGIVKHGVIISSKHDFSRWNRWCNSFLHNIPKLARKYETSILSIMINYNHEIPLSTSPHKIVLSFFFSFFAMKSHSDATLSQSTANDNLSQNALVFPLTSHDVSTISCMLSFWELPCPWLPKAGSCIITASYNFSIHIYPSNDI